MTFVTALGAKRQATVMRYPVFALFKPDTPGAREALKSAKAALRACSRGSRPPGRP